MKFNRLKYLTFIISLTYLSNSCSNKNDYCSSFTQSLGEVKTGTVLDTVRFKFIDYWGFTVDTNVSYSFISEPYPMKHFVDNNDKVFLQVFYKNDTYTEDEKENYFESIKLVYLAQASADSFSNIYEERINERDNYFLKSFKKIYSEPLDYYLYRISSNAWLFYNKVLILTIAKEDINESSISDEELELRLKCILQNLEITYSNSYNTSTEELKE